MQPGARSAFFLEHLPTHLDHRNQLAYQLVIKGMTHLYGPQDHGWEAYKNSAKNNNTYVRKSRSAVRKSQTTQAALNGICPYFTMFPLAFPLNILKRRAKEGALVLDPFCGRGTTNFAARLVGLNSLGVDSSPVAAAVTASKLVTTTIHEILAEARRILAAQEARHIPGGEFWQLAYHSTVLNPLCRFREAFLEDCSTAPRIALRGIVLGALHGPKQKVLPSYFSNQCPRTYAPKPAYATRYWQARGLSPEPVHVLAVIERRAKRYYRALSDVTGRVRLADSRAAEALQPENSETRFDWVITSPRTTECAPISRTNGCATGS